MSAYEQRIEPPDRRWQYLLLAAEPYETIAFKVIENSTSLLLLIIFSTLQWHNTSPLVFLRFRAEKSIKQKIASGRTGTEKQNKYRWTHLLPQCQTGFLIQEHETGFNPPIFFLPVLPPVPLQNGESSPPGQRTTTSCWSETPPSSYEWSWRSSTQWFYAPSPTRRDACPPSPAWCPGCPPHAPSDAHAPHANEAASSWRP